VVYRWITGSVQSPEKAVAACSAARTMPMGNASSASGWRRTKRGRNPHPSPRLGQPWRYCWCRRVSARTPFTASHQC